MTAEILGNKKCPKCLENKDIKEFAKNASKPTGRASYCKVCQRYLAKQWRNQNKEYCAYKRKEYQKIPEVIKKRNERSRLDYKNKRKKYYQALNLKKFNLSVDDFKRIEKEQNYKCCICKNECDTKASLCVDHDHRTGKFRGLLCRKCNLGLGNFKDNINYLTEAINYLSKFK